jgi:hypothetical protein
MILENEYKITSTQLSCNSHATLTQLSHNSHTKFVRKREKNELGIQDMFFFVFKKACLKSFGHTNSNLESKCCTKGDSANQQHVIN